MRPRPVVQDPAPPRSQVWPGAHAFSRSDSHQLPLPPSPRAPQAMRRTPQKRAPKTYERPGLSEEEIEEIREAFNRTSPL